MGTPDPSRRPRPFPEPPAGFDDPLEMLFGCHRRIEKQLETLKRLRQHLASKGIDAEASAAAEAVLRYFRKAAVDHHEDEEQDVFPLLERRIDDPDEKARFAHLRTRLESEHRKLEESWTRVRKPLEGIAEGLMRPLAEEDVRALADGVPRTYPRGGGGAARAFPLSRRAGSSRHSAARWPRGAAFPTARAEAMGAHTSQLTGEAATVLRSGGGKEWSG